MKITPLSGHGSAALLFLVFLVLFCCSGSGEIFVVTATNDSLNITSLRGAIMAANYNRADNTIILGQATNLRGWQHQGGAAPFFYRLTISGADENAGRTGDLDVTHGNLTIAGMSSNVIIDATGLGDRVFQVFTNAHLTLTNLTIRGGSAPVGEAGGAILNSGMLTIQNCSIVENQSGDGGFGDGFSTPGGDGGGICNEGIAQLSECIISNNITGYGAGPDIYGFSAIGGNGGGIYNSGNITLSNCVVDDNLCGNGGNGGQYEAGGTIDNYPPTWAGAAGGCGAGLFNAGNMTLNFCTVDVNVCGNGGNGGSGGAGANGGAGGSGGGINNAGAVSLNTCTISANFSGTGGTGGNGELVGAGIGGDGGNGGGIYSEGTLNMTSCTIALNEAGAGGNGGNSSPFADSAAGGGQGGDAGGILNDGNNTNVVIRNSLIALNASNIGGTGGTGQINDLPFTGDLTGATGTNGFGYDLVGDFTSQGFNLIGMADGSTGFTNGVSADQVGSDANPIDPLLGPLQMNGGFAPTQALLWGSPAINQGNCFGIHTDQRGHYRPQDYPSIPHAIGGDGSDVGAYELDAP